MNSNHKANANPSIECSVTDCSHHCGVVNYCNLDCVKIGTTNHVTADNRSCTDCKSFVKK